MDTHLLAYLAGVIDADGYILIYRKLGPKRLDGRYPMYYMLKVGCNQITSDLPNLLKDTFGGKVYQFKPQTRTNGQPWYMWSCHSRQAAHVMRTLLPYLRLKYRQAELGIQFDNLIQDQLSRPVRALITEEMEAKRDELYSALRQLNHPRNPRYSSGTLEEGTSGR